MYQVAGKIAQLNGYQIQPKYTECSKINETVFNNSSESRHLAAYADIKN